MRPLRVLVLILLLGILPLSAQAVFDSAQFNAGSGPLALLSVNPAGEEVV